MQQAGKGLTMGGTRRSTRFHRLEGSVDPKPAMPEKHKAWLASFAAAALAGGEKTVKKAFDKAEEMLEELLKRTS